MSPRLHMRKSTRPRHLTASAMGPLALAAASIGAASAADGSKPVQLPALECREPDASLGHPAYRRLSQPAAAMGGDVTR